MSHTVNPGPEIMALWAKLKKEEGQEGAYHPLIYHLLDVAASAEALWRYVLSDPARESVARALGLSADGTGRWIAFLAGTHDLGKASPSFFQQDPDGPGRLRRTGCEPGPPCEKAPHGTISARELRLLLQQFGVNRPLALRLAMVVGGHHGKIPSINEMTDAIPMQCVGSESGPWPDLRQSLIFALGELLGIPREAPPTRLSSASAFWLAGLVSVADWIGSNQRYSRFAAPDAHTPPPYNAGYLDEARINAHRALVELGWLAQPSMQTDLPFEALFGFEPNAMQKQVIALGDRLDRQGLVIIEAPMGTGKTEAALWLADQWRQRLGQRGFYVALPTQATSDQMFGRVSEFLVKRHPGQALNVQLLHGHAALSSQLKELRQRGYALFRPGEIGELAGESIAAAEWFTNRKRGLLAPFGVGTVDQALLAALQVKHVFVRLFGLAHKTVIVDEVHAYDVYMSTLLDRLVEWLAAVGSTVVLLSATLPEERRRELGQAFRRGLGAEQELHTESYPRMTWVSSECIMTIPFDGGGSREVEVKWVDGTVPDIAGAVYQLGLRLREALARGGTAVVICNTVARAQRVYRALKSYFPDEASDGCPELDLLHARYPFDMRQARENRTLLRYGKSGATVDGDGEKEAVNRPWRSVLVATQIVEQSLDLDFDIMITDIAPVDLVLQRIGRLWRHERETRPTKKPQLWIVRPPQDADGLPAFEKADQYVYFPHVLFRSWLALKDKRSIDLPDDVSPLVESVYGAAIADGLPAPMQTLWRKTIELQEKDLEREAWEAQKRIIGEPWSSRHLSWVQGSAREEERPEIHPALQMMTRLTDPSVQVVLLTRAGGQVTLPSGREIDLDTEPNGPLVEALLRRSLTVADRRLVGALLQEEPPKGWQQSPLLRNYRLIDLSADGRGHVGKYEVALDAELGLIAEKKGR